MSNSSIERKVRQRAGFVCQACGRVVDCQYAHIIPDSWGGLYREENLLWLCNPCHRKFEVVDLPKDSPKALALINEMKRIVKKKNSNKLISDCFQFYSDDMEIKLGNGFVINNTPIIIKYVGEYGFEFPFLTLKKDDRKLLISGFFFDKNHKVLLEIHDNKFTAHSENIWDISIKRNSILELTSKDKEINFKIEQNNSGFLLVTGVLYFFGKKYDLSEKLIDPSGGIYSNNQISNCNCGISINKNGVIFIG